MSVPALVLAVVAALVALAAVTVIVVGVLARVHRLPRNRVLGVRTAWTMGRVDTWRRANHAAAPAFVAAGAVGLVAAGASVVTPSTGAAVVLLVLAAVGLVGLLGAGGIVGARFAAAEEAEERAMWAAAAEPCTAGAPAPVEEPADCAPIGACGGACSLCPRATTGG